MPFENVKLQDIIIQNIKSAFVYNQASPIIIK